MRPAVIPRISPGTTWSPCSITIQCTGRTNWAVPAPQRMRRAIGSASSAACTMPGRSFAACSPGRVVRQNRNSPLVVVEARELIDLHAAGVGKCARSARRLAGGVERGRDRRAAALDPLLRLAVEQLRDLHREAPRREIRERRAVREAGGIQARDRCPSRNASPRATRLFGGISSAPISTRKSWRFMGASSCGRWPPNRCRRDSPRIPSQQWKALCFAAGEVGAGDGAGERTHAQDVALALGDGNRLARVEQVEDVRGLQRLLVRGQRQRRLEQRLAVLLALVEIPRRATRYPRARS